MIRVAACDPGVTGAFAVYTPMAEMLEVFPMPSAPVQVSGKLRMAVDMAGVHRLLSTLGLTTLVLEQVGGIAGQSASAAFNFGKGFGYVQMAAFTLGVPVHQVTPTIWKGALRVPRDKKAARVRASELLPRHAHLWPYAKDDGLAEAAMLAYWAADQISKGRTL